MEIVLGIVTEEIRKRETASDGHRYLYREWYYLCR